MSSAPAGNHLPPGRNGLPVLGETLSFLRNPFRFIEGRLATHGRIFRSNILGRKTIVFAGAEAAGRFSDGSIIMREGSMPPHVQELFGGRNLPLLDGEIHTARKRVVLQAFTRDALAVYLPAIQDSVERYFKSWSALEEIRWLDEMKRLSIEVICTNVIGMPPGEEMDGLRRDYITLTSSFSALPINLPGTRYRNALQARDRIMDALRAHVRERRTTPCGDGLSRMIAAADAPQARLTDEEVALELHHIVIAGFIVYAELAALVQQLTAHPDVRSKLTAEIAASARSGALTPQTLAAMPYLMRVLNEVKRLCPITPAIFGKARQQFAFDGVTVPAGWMVLWALRPSHVSQSTFTDPERFDPDRFSPDRAEHRRHEHAFVLEGAAPVTGHRCPGLGYATCVMAVFGIVLLRNYSWRLPPQNFEIDWRKNPPELNHGLRATLTMEQ